MYKCKHEFELCACMCMCGVNMYICLYTSPSIQSSEFSSFHANENSPNLSATVDRPRGQAYKIDNGVVHVVHVKC